VRRGACQRHEYVDATPAATSAADAQQARGGHQRPHRCKQPLATTTAANTTANAANANTDKGIVTGGVVVVARKIKWTAQCGTELLSVRVVCGGVATVGVIKPRSIRYNERGR
jgi:hypothetical protein